MIVNYDCTVIMIVTYDPKTFIVQATGLPRRNIVAYWASSTATKIKKSTTLTGERWRRRKRWTTWTPDWSWRRCGLFAKSPQTSRLLRQLFSDIGLSQLKFEEKKIWKMKLLIECFFFFDNLRTKNLLRTSYDHSQVQRSVCWTSKWDQIHNS